MENPIANEIYLNQRQDEWLVAIPLENDAPADYAPEVALVYRFDRILNRSVYQYAYKFVGVRINSLPNTGLQADGGYAPPNGAFDLPHAIDCVRKRYGLPPTAANANR